MVSEYHSVVDDEMLAKDVVKYYGQSSYVYATAIVPWYYYIIIVVSTVYAATYITWWTWLLIGSLIELQYITVQPQP